MLNAELIRLLKDYHDTWVSGFFPYVSLQREEEKTIYEKFLHFAGTHPDVFERHHYPGHFTASALVTNNAMTKVLLTHHRKLDLWLQLGGHAEGNRVLHAVAKQEVSEESGLEKFAFLPYEHLIRQGPLLNVSSPLPFDLDCHLIPPRPNEPSHFHYDVRFLMVADDAQSVHVSEESHDVKWFTVETARTVTDERSMHRQFDKLLFLRGALGVSASAVDSALIEVRDREQSRNPLSE